MVCTIDIESKVRGIARQEATKTGDVDRAVDQVRARLGKDGWEQFKAECAEDALRRMVREYIHSVAHSFRSEAFASAVNGEKPTMTTAEIESSPEFVREMDVAASKVDRRYRNQSVFKEMMAVKRNEIVNNMRLKVAVMTRNYLNLFMVGAQKKPLGDCTGPELLEESKGDRSRAKGYMRRVKFFRAVARKCGDKKVRDVCSNLDIEKTMRSVGLDTVD